VADGIPAGADVQGVGVGEKRQATGAAHVIDDAAQKRRPDVGHIARLAEVQLDGHQIPLVNDPGQARAFHEAAELLDEVFFPLGAQIHVVYGAGGHKCSFGEISDLE